MKVRGKILSTLLFTALLLGVFYISMFSDNEVENKITNIELNGNNHLSKENYIKFAKLDKISDYKFLSLPVIKDRLEKHPYISEADVKFSSKDVVTIEVQEKVFQAVILSNGSNYLITKDYDVLPLIDFTKNIELPLIANPKISEKIKIFSKWNNEEVKTAFRIIDAAKLTNLDLFANISEIDLRDGKEIVISMTDLECPVVFGRGSEVQKIVYFDSIWSRLQENKAALTNLNYVDLRFEKLIFLGMHESEPVEQENQG